jgi:hypothetical protein
VPREDDLAAGMTGHMAHAGGTQTLADEARDAELAQVEIRPRLLSGPNARLATTSMP